jgi:hypothetical protein
MTTTRPRIFISYSSKDREAAERLVSALLLNAVQVWYDQRDIDVGDHIYDKIHQGLLEVDFLGVILTSRSLESTWVKEELSLAKQRELEERNVIVLPLLFEQVTLPLHLRSRKFANFTDFDTGFRELMRAMNRQTSVSAFDYSLRQRVREAISSFGSGTAEEIQEVRSQNAARLVRRTLLPVNRIREQPNTDATDDSSLSTIFVDIESAQVSIPIQVSLTERAGSVLARVLQAVDLDQIVLKGQRFSFFLAYEGIPLELDERLVDADIAEGGHLQIGAYTFLIE